MDRDILRALGYSDEKLDKIAIWESKLKEYFKNDGDYKNRLESYYQTDFAKEIIAFRDSCPKQIADDLNRIFHETFSPV